MEHGTSLRCDLDLCRCIVLSLGALLPKSLCILRMSSITRCADLNEKSLTSHSSKILSQIKFDCPIHSKKLSLFRPTTKTNNDFIANRIINV